MFYNFFDCSLSNKNKAIHKKVRVLIIYNEDGIIGLHMVLKLASKQTYLNKQNDFFQKYKTKFNLIQKENKLIEQVISDYIEQKSDDKKLNSIKINWEQIEATDFQKKVWQELKKIGFGQSQSYKQISTSLNSNAFRAVGSACGKNPIMIFIPCHRVLASNGKLGGFASGLELKKDLLNIESISYKK